MDQQLERMTKSRKSGLKFPVARIKTMLRVQNYAHRISDTGAIFLTAVLEYICAEILEHSLNAARSLNRNRIQPHHINMAFRSDPEFLAMFPRLIIPRSTFVSVYPTIMEPRRIRNAGPPAAQRSAAETREDASDADSED